ncbi:hypothetical protein J4462_04035 [Candidatus Pacearchaeota archaeon]|nr:hypothetical protein [Candidatus Pacearchaeota archaeon]
MKRQITIPVEQELFELIENVAKKEQRSKTSFIRFHIQKICEEKNAN